MRTKTWFALVAVGAMLAAASIHAARAHADTVDDLYVNSLHEVGITSGNGDAGLIVLGHITCNAFAIGESFSDVETLILSNNPRLGSTGAAQIIGAATAAYCDSYAWKFGGTPRAPGVMA